MSCTRWLLGWKFCSSEKKCRSKMTHLFPRGICPNVAPLSAGSSCETLLYFLRYEAGAWDWIWALLQKDKATHATHLCFQAPGITLHMLALTRSQISLKRSQKSAQSAWSDCVRHNRSHLVTPRIWRWEKKCFCSSQKKSELVSLSQRWKSAAIDSMMTCS